MYEVEYNDGHTASLAANLITDDLFAQVYQAGNPFTILYSTAGTRTYCIQVIQKDTFVHTSTSNKRRVNTAKVWDIFIQWK